MVGSNPTVGSNFVDRKRGDQMSPEMKVMLGCRLEDSDGFTYVHGKCKAGRLKRPRNRMATSRHIRTDKRRVKAKEMAFEFSLFSL